MKTYAYLGAFFASFLLLGTGIVESLENDRISAPVFQEGEYWEFEHFDVANPQFYNSRYRTPPDGVFHYFPRFEIKDGGIDGNMRSLEFRPFLYAESDAKRIGDETTEEINKKWYDFPLYVGKKWNYHYFYLPDYLATTTRGGTHRKATMEVQGIALITTPAGSCETFKIRRGDPGRRSGTYYYCPQTKSLFRFDLDPVTLPNGEVVTVSTTLVKYRLTSVE